MEDNFPQQVTTQPSIETQTVTTSSEASTDARILNDISLLYQRSQENIDRSDKLQAQSTETSKRVENTQTLMVVGFFVLLVMVATLVGMVGLDYKNAVEKLHNDQYQFQQQQLNFLINQATSSASSQTDTE